MINYLKSENYRVLRRKSLYLTSVIGLFLIAAAAVVLYVSHQGESDFPYATSSFFYSNLLSSSGVFLILVIAFVFNLALTGKDTSIIKQSVSFGISRNTIFWSKLILTLSYFLLICIIGLLLMIGLGENLLATKEHSISRFIIACLNILPIVVGGFFMIHMLRMLKVGEVYAIILLFVIFIFSGGLLRLMLRPISGLNEFYKYAPSSLLDNNLTKFMNQTVQIDYRFWIVGIVISGISLLIGAKKFAKQNIN